METLVFAIDAHLPTLQTCQCDSVPSSMPLTPGTGGGVVGHCEGASDGVTVFLWDVLESCAGSYHWLWKVTAVRKRSQPLLWCTRASRCHVWIGPSPGGGDPVSMVGRGGGRAQVQPCFIARGNSPAQPRMGSCSPRVTARHALCVTSSSSSHPAAPDTAVWGSADEGPAGAE